GRRTRTQANAPGLGMQTEVRGRERVASGPRGQYHKPSTPPLSRETKQGAATRTVLPVRGVRLARAGGAAGRRRRPPGPAPRRLPVPAVLGPALGPRPAPGGSVRGPCRGRRVLPALAGIGAAPMVPGPVKFVTSAPGAFDRVGAGLYTRIHI